MFNIASLSFTPSCSSTLAACLSRIALLRHSVGAVDVKARSGLITAIRVARAHFVCVDCWKNDNDAEMQQVQSLETRTLTIALARLRLAHVLVVTACGVTCCRAVDTGVLIAVWR